MIKCGGLFVVVLIGFTVCIGSFVNGDDVFASSADINILAEEEKSFIGTMKVYLEYEKHRIKALERLIAEVEDEIETSGSMDHPLNVINLIHRFTTKWSNPNATNIYDLLIDFDAYQNLRDELSKILAVWPTVVDYTGAKSSIIRLHKTYMLPANDTINGIMLGHKTKPMSQQMAVDIGLYALSRGLVDDALEWLTHALNHLIPPLQPKQDIYHALAQVFAKKGELIKSIDFVRKALELDPSNSAYLSAMQPNDNTTVNPWPTDMDGIDYRRLCRESIVEFNENSSDDFSCFHKYSGVVPFYRYKVEPLHFSPDIMIFHDFLTDNEATQLRTMAISKINMAVTGTANSSRISEARVGKTGWFWDHGPEPFVPKLSKRISEATGLETDHPSSEALQLSNYGIGGHYTPHWDYFVEEDMRENGNIPSDVVQSGDRIATFMLYLNNVKAGGATVFPRLSVATRPIPNAGIFWYNYKRSGDIDKNTQHAACPVLIGEKWVANKWLREFGQEFRRRCDLSNEEVPLGRLSGKLYKFDST